MTYTTNMTTIPTFFKNIKVTVEEPTKLDVLCGSKSKAIANHPGNVILREKVEQSLDDYKNANNKQERITINRSIIQTMRRKYGSRFLKQNQDGTWSIAEEQAVRDKVSHAIRHALAKQQKANEPSSKRSSLESTKRYELYEDSEDAETKKLISEAYDRQQEILASMMSKSATGNGTGCRQVSLESETTIDAADDDNNSATNSYSSSDSESDEELVDFLNQFF